MNMTTSMRDALLQHEFTAPTGVHRLWTRNRGANSAVALVVRGLPTMAALKDVVTNLKDQLPAEDMPAEDPSVQDLTLLFRVVSDSEGLGLAVDRLLENRTLVSLNTWRDVEAPVPALGVKLGRALKIGFFASVELAMENAGDKNGNRHGVRAHFTLSAQLQIKNDLVTAEWFAKRAAQFTGSTLPKLPKLKVPVFETDVFIPTTVGSQKEL